MSTTVSEDYPPLEAPKTLRPQDTAAASTTEALNIVHSGSISPASTGMLEKLLWRWELKASRQRPPPDVPSLPALLVWAYQVCPPIGGFRSGRPFLPITPLQVYPSLPTCTLKSPSKTSQPGPPRRLRTLNCCLVLMHRQQSEFSPQPLGVGRRTSRPPGGGRMKCHDALCSAGPHGRPGNQALTLGPSVRAWLPGPWASSGQGLTHLQKKLHFCKSFALSYVLTFTKDT